MGAKQYIIAIDSGTQSIRAVLFDRFGLQIAIEQADYEPYFSREPGWAEQHAEDYWAKLCHVCRKLMAGIDIDRNRIAGIGMTSQRNTVIPLDVSGNALRPAIIWLDQRKTLNPPYLSRAVEIGSQLIGQGEALSYARRNSKFLWIRQNEPEVYNRTYKFAQVTGFFVHKLTGKFRDSYAMVSGISPFDYKHLRYFGAPMGFIYNALGIEKRQCVELFPPGTVLGHISAEASHATGLPEGLPLVVGGGDKQSEMLGAGAIDPSIAVISFGTGTSMEVVSRTYLNDPAMRYFTWPAAIPDVWVLETFIMRGFWMVTWFKQEFGYREGIEAARRNVAPEAILDEVIKDIPPGSMGLMLHPHWSPSVSSKYSKGSIIGFSDVHNRACIYRAILEGICFELRRMQEIVQKRTRIPIREIRVGGGGSLSNVAVQIASDMFNLPVSRMATHETAALGAAMDAAVGTRMYETIDEAVASMTGRGCTFLPDPCNHQIYSRLFEEVYKNSFISLEPIYRRIADITGYPC
jgi:sugar (pentulose or hexulose) kinase